MHLSGCISGHPAARSVTDARSRSTYVTHATGWVSGRAALRFRPHREAEVRTALGQPAKEWPVDEVLVGTGDRVHGYGHILHPPTAPAGAQGSRQLRRDHPSQPSAQVRIPR